MNEIEMLFVEETGQNLFGLPVVKVNGDEYAVAEDDDQADEAARLAARELLWAFNTSFLRKFMSLNEAQIEAVSKMQSSLSEDAQPIIEALLGDGIDECVERAINEDGRSHFLANYDGEEQDGEDVTPALAGKLLYRVG